MQRRFLLQNWRAKRIQITDIRRGIVVALFCAFSGQLLAADEIKIDVRQSNEAIRQKLLQLKPIGTSTQKVFEFAQSRLQREGRSLAGLRENPTSDSETLFTQD